MCRAPRSMRLASSISSCAVSSGSCAIWRKYSPTGSSGLTALISPNGVHGAIFALRSSSSTSSGSSRAEVLPGGVRCLARPADRAGYLALGVVPFLFEDFQHIFKCDISAPICAVNEFLYHRSVQPPRQGVPGYACSIVRIRPRVQSCAKN